MPFCGKKNRINKLTEAIKECHISSAPNETNGSTSNTVTFSNNDPTLPRKWPPVKVKVPDIFLHKPVDFKQHVHKLLSMDVKFYQPYQSTYYTKIKCVTFNDHKALIQYFENQQLPYHTFGHPNKRKLKVVIRGLPKSIDLNALKKELKAASIPVIRMHKMNIRENVKDTSLILVVVPHNEEGRKLIKVKKILDYEVKTEPPENKVKQCHRCQMWGHTQRYCHGQVKCVKCAGEHLSKKCERDASKEPPKCANCGGEHTASYRKCSYCPASLDHRYSVSRKKVRKMLRVHKNAEIVTVGNCDFLYKNALDRPNVKNVIKKADS